MRARITLAARYGMHSNTTLAAAASNVRAVSGANATSAIAAATYIGIRMHDYHAEVRTLKGSHGEQDHRSARHPGYIPAALCRLVEARRPYSRPRASLWLW